jgi:hypothetical protein
MHAGKAGHSARGLLSVSMDDDTCETVTATAKVAGLQEVAGCRFVGASALYFDGHFTRMFSA